MLLNQTWSDAYNYYYTSIKINGGVKKGWQYNKVHKQEELG